MLVGLYVEKGLGQDYCSIDRGKSAQRLVIDETWLWHDFQSDVLSGRFLEPMNKIFRQTGVQPELRIEGGYASLGFKPEEKTRYKRDEFVFRYMDETGRLSAVKASHEGAVLGRLEECGDLGSLGSELSKFTRNSFVWIDVLIGLSMLLGSKNRNAWNAASIVAKILEPLEEWLR